MASSLKVVLRKKVGQDGTYPLALRITVDRKSSFIYLGQSIRLADWDEKAEKVKKSHPNSVRLNNLILQKKAEANDKFLEMEAHQTAVSSDLVRSKIKSRGGVSFFDQAEVFLENFRKSGKYNRFTNETSHLKHFRVFLKGRDIAFTEISVTLLTRFRVYLKSSRNAGERTITNYLMTIRTIYNQAITAGLVDPKYYPFGKGKVAVRIPESVKIGLTAEEVTMFENADLSDCPAYWAHARNIWLISFYFAGMRVSDVLRLKHADFFDGRMYYTMGKNAKPGSVKVVEKALRIVDQYPKATKHDLVFPELQTIENLGDTYEVQHTIATTLIRINTSLQKLAKRIGLKKKLTMHIARHTFGNISGDRISIQLLQKLYRHSSITTTIRYQGNFIHKDTDEALDSVLGS